MIKPKSVDDVTLFGRKISAVHPDVQNIVHSKNERWFIYVHTSDDGRTYEEEIYWKGRTVVISLHDAHLNKNILKSCYTVDSDVKDVFYTHFYMKENCSDLTKCLCILEKECLSVFNDSGDSSVAALPFKVKRVWALHNGVCIEREILSSDEADKKGMPTLFSLTHPLEDFKPIVYRYQDSKKSMYFTDSTQSIVFTNPIKHLVMTYDSVLGLHSLWAVHKALEKDFPDAPSHQDSLPEFLAFSNHSTNIGDLKNQSRLSFSPAPNKRHSCPPIPFNHAGKRMSPARNGSPISKIFSPAIQNQIHRHSPHHHGANDFSHISNEHSIPRKSRLCSPMIFRMSYDESVLEEELEPLPPDIILEQVWQEQGNMIRHGIKGKAEHAFMVTDFHGSVYIGYFIKVLSKLRLLKLESKSGLSFEKVLEIECLSAVHVQNLHMLIVLDLSQNIQLYTGKQKIGTLNMSNISIGNVKGSMQQNIRLKHFTSTSFVLCDSDDECIKRIELNNLFPSELVQRCVVFLKDIISENEYNLVCSKYYSMMHDENNFGDSSWDKFVHSSLKLFGFSDAFTKILKGNISSPAPPEPKKAKKSNSFDGVEDWEYLLASEPNSAYPKKYEHELQKYLVEVSVRVNAPLYKYISDVFITWHQLYEELKLNVLESPHLANFAKFLCYMSRVLHATCHTNVYETDFPELKKNQDTIFKLKENAMDKLKNFTTTECSFYEKIHDSFSNVKSVSNTSTNDKMKTTTVLTKIMSAIVKESKKSEKDMLNALSDLKIKGNESLAETIIHIMVSEDFHQEDIEHLPIGYKIPIKEILHHFKGTNHLEMSLETATFLGRDDIIALQSQKFFEKKKYVPIEGTEDKDGMYFNEEIFKFRFNEDLRVNEVKSLLNSSKPSVLSLVQNPDVNDHAFAKEEETKLLLINERTMCLPVARGMFTLGTSQPVASETVSIPSLDLTGRSTTKNKMVQNTQTEPSITQMWPLFHNGVAAGLKIAPGASQIDSTWILFNKLKFAELNASHSGFLLALGLTGHLSVLPKFNLLDYLSKGHELTTVALLLGISATQIGSKNAYTLKLLSLHLDSLLPSTALELNIPKCSQVATIISLGLLFFNSVASHLVKVLLYEIGRPPGPEMENNDDRESHALAAGIALGMIMIGHGKDHNFVGDINVSDRLYHYVFGGRRNDKLTRIHDKTQVPSCRIQEGELVNTNVTSSAAVIALSLMYLKTNNSDIASWLNVTDTENMTDLLKPDDALLRMFAYNLIMWDELVPTPQWLNNLLPKIGSLFDTNGELSKDGSNLDVNYVVCMLAGCFLALGLKFAGSANLAAFQIMFPWISKIKNISTSLVEELHAKVVFEQCLNTILISVSLVMCGTGNIKVLRVARQLRKRCSTDVSYGNHMAVHMAIGFLFLGGGKYTLKTDNLSIACLLCSVYPKWPKSSKDNRFHLQALRHLFVLASEPRLFITRDINTQQLCYVPIEVTVKGSYSYPESTLKLLSPCFVPQLKEIIEIKIVGPRYWPITFKISNSNFMLQHLRSIFVKKKAGYLSYSEDPKGKRNVLGRTFTSQSDQLNLVKSFNSNPSVVLFEEVFCSTKNKNCKERKDLFSNFLYECVTKDKLDAIEDHLTLEHIVGKCERGIVSVYDMQQLQLLFGYTANIRRMLVNSDAVSSVSLINELYQTKCQLRVENAMTSHLEKF